MEGRGRIVRACRDYGPAARSREGGLAPSARRRSAPSEVGLTRSSVGDLGTETFGQPGGPCVPDHPPSTRRKGADGERNAERLSRQSVGERGEHERRNAEGGAGPRV